MDRSDARIGTPYPTQVSLNLLSLNIYPMAATLPEFGGVKGTNHRGCCPREKQPSSLLEEMNWKEG